jgi:hypothetical protein
MTKRKAAKGATKLGNSRKRRAGQKSERGSRTKTRSCLDLLSQAAGATLVELQKATGWQPHSVSGFLAGTVRKKLGLDLTSTKEERGRVYCARQERRRMKALPLTAGEIADELRPLESLRLVLSLAPLITLNPTKVDASSLIVIWDFPLQIRRRGVEMRLVIEGAADAASVDPILLKELLARIVVSFRGVRDWEDCLDVGIVRPRRRRSAICQTPATFGIPRSRDRKCNCERHAPGGHDSK